MKKVLFLWLLMVCVVTFVCFACYGTEQQQNRLSANEPQVQMAEDAAAALQSGANPNSLIQGKIDISQSLFPFIIIYDQNSNILASSAVLDGTTPTLPVGFFDKVPQTGDNRLTWQPRVGLRFATVTVRYSGENPGYVVAGRSLRETESRIDILGTQIFIGWGIGVVGFFVVLLILRAIFGFWKKEK